MVCRQAFIVDAMISLHVSLHAQSAYVFALLFTLVFLVLVDVCHSPSIELHIAIFVVDVMFKRLLD